MIKIIGICGSRVEAGNVEAYLKNALAYAAGQAEVETELINLVDKKIGPCLHCNWCLRKQTPEKYCARDDDMAEIYPKLLAADGIVVASPVHFGRLSGLAADMIDRTRAFIHGLVYKFPLKNKVGGGMAAAYFRGGGVETTLFSLDLFFLTHQMIVANSGLSQLGAAAFSSREGKGGFEKDIRHMTLQDDYGLLSAKILMDRMIELCRIVQAGVLALNKG